MNRSTQNVTAKYTNETTDGGTFQISAKTLDKPPIIIGCCAPRMKHSEERCVLYIAPHEVGSRNDHFIFLFLSGW